MEELKNEVMDKIISWPQDDWDNGFNSALNEVLTLIEEKFNGKK